MREIYAFSVLFAPIFGRKADLSSVNQPAVELSLRVVRIVHVKGKTIVFSILQLEASKVAGVSSIASSRCNQF